MKKFILLLAIISLISPIESFAAQWQKVTGHYAYVEYEAPYDSLALSLLAIADAEIPRLAHLHGFTDRQITRLPKARIILTDKPDISNGYALGNSVVIYALSSMYMPFWSEQKSWYHLVLTHELTHWVTFKALHRKLSFLGEASLATTPRWFFEGIAQYFAESWNLFRGDYYVKRAVLSGQLNASALSSRLLYPSANSFIRYLSFTYGDSALIRLMRYEPNAWYYDFDKAFKAVFKKNVNDLFPDFVRYAVLYYGDFLADLPVARFPEKLPSFIDQPTAIFPLSEKDSLYLVAGRTTSADKDISLQIVQIKNGQTQILQKLSDRLRTQVCLSRDHRFIAYGEPYYSVEADQIALRFQWRLFDRQSKHSQKILKPLRSRYGTFGKGRHLYLAEVLPNETRLLKFDPRTGQTEVVLKSKQPIGKLTADKNGTLFFTRQNQNGQRELCVWKNRRLTVLKGDIEAPRSPVALGERYLAFNEVRQQQPGITLYDLERDSVVSRWTDQFIYWLSAADSANDALIAFRYQADGKARFFAIPVDSVLNFPAQSRLPEPNRYGQWQHKPPFLPDTLHIPAHPAIALKPSRKRLPFFPMEHLMSFALPFYDKEYGYGIYGSTVWTEILQRQLLTAGFWITPLHPNRSVFLINHELKWMNTDISTYVYYGPVILTHPEGTRHQLNISLRRILLINGNERWQVDGKLAYSYFDHRFKKNAPYPVKKVWFQGPSVRLSFRYHLPSARESAIPRRTIGIEAFYFNTMPNSNYKFRLFESNLTLANKLFSDAFGFVDRLSFIRQQGHLLPFQIVGVDRYYEFDMPREYLFTRTIRGLRENIDADQLLWNALEFRYFLKQSTPYKLIFLPIRNVTIDAFFDYARLGSQAAKEVASTGFQLSFGEQFMRFSAGYARTFKQWRYHNETYFGRISILLYALQSVHSGD